MYKEWEESPLLTEVDNMIRRAEAFGERHRQLAGSPGVNPSAAKRLLRVSLNMDKVVERLQAQRSAAVNRAAASRL